MPARQAYRTSRLRQPVAGWSRSRRRRVRLRRAPVAVLGLVLLLALVAAASAADSGGGVERGDVMGPAGDAAGPDTPRHAPAELGADRSARGAPAPGGAGRALFARYEDVALRLPHPEPDGVRFTEGRRVGAVPLEPVGELTANANPESFDPATVHRSPDGPQFAVSADAGRGRPATSAGVITLPRGARVGAPVAGEVDTVEQYHGAHGPDWAVIVSPRGRTDLHVTVTGLHRPAVAPGDVVEPGDPLAVPRLDPSGRAEIEIEAGPASAPTALDVEQS